MSLDRRVCLPALAIVTLGMLLGMAASAQGPEDLTAENSATTTTDPPPAPQKAAGADSDDTWHFSLAPFIYVPGIHGTVGALGHDVSVHVSGSDVLSTFNGGLAGIFEADKGRFVMPINFFWARLATTKDFLLTDFGQRSA